MYGPFDGAFVSGGARVREGVLYIPKTDNKEVINAGDPAVFAVIDTTHVVTRTSSCRLSRRCSTTCAWTCSLGVDRDTWVRSQEANVEIYSDGDLRINVDRERQALTLDGVVNTDRGEYAFLSKRFQIKRGTATFVGTQEINPLLQLTGEYEVKQAGRQALFIRILIGGTLLSPRLTLESDAQPPISQSDLLSYLAFGSESGSLLQFGGSSVSGGTAGGGLVGTSAALATQQLAGVALGVAVQELEGEAARSLGADVFNITPCQRAHRARERQLRRARRASSQARRSSSASTSRRRRSSASTRSCRSARSRASASSTASAASPGLSIESTLQPRFFLPEPSLSDQELTGRQLVRAVPGAALAVLRA